MAISMPARRFWVLLATIVVFSGTATLPAQKGKDQAALQLLKNAARAYQEKNFPAAVEQYRRFVSAHAGHPQTPAARYGLALALLELSGPDHAGALEQLQMLANNKDRPEFPSVLYHTGLAWRGLGVRDEARAAGAPTAEAAKMEASARQHFQDAAKQFAAAAGAFTDREDRQWSARARCDQAEMLLRTGQLKEARAAVAPVLKDKQAAKDGRLLRLGLYYDGLAAFLLKDYTAAGRDLSLTAPFSDAGFGTHARYLLARVHHLLDERAEAAAHYDGVLADHEAAKKKAVQALRTSEVQKNPRERTRLEKLVRGPAPEHVGQAQFYLGVLQAEAGRFADAQGRFAAFLKQNPKSPLGTEAQLRLGICQVNARQGNEALRTLQPLAGREAPLDDQTLLWIGKAHAAGVDPKNAAASKQALVRAAEALEQAAKKAGAAADPEGKTRAAVARFELADTLQLLGQHREAAATYQQLLDARSLPGREPELLQRLADALNLAGDYDGSDRICDRFEQLYPKNPLRSSVCFRRAENAAFRYLAAEQNPSLPNRDRELQRLGAESAKSYEAVVAQFPEFEYANLARYGLALGYYRRGDLEKAGSLFAAIAGPDRQGDLAIVSYLHADCLIRQVPAKVVDAVTAGKVREALQPAIEQLEAFIGSQRKESPLVPEALLKLGHCYQRLAGLSGQPAERTTLLQSARTGYKKIYAAYPPQHPAQAKAVFEEAKCFMQMNVPQRALTNLQRFTREPFAASPMAPLALLQLGNLLRGQNKPGDGANVLNLCRERYGPALLKDPARAPWYPLILLHQGICLKEAGKLPEARGLFEHIEKDFPTAPEAAEAALRRGQCLRDEAMRKSERGRQQLAAARKPEDVAAAMKALGEDLKLLREATQYLETRAERLKDTQPPSEMRARMLYDAAWINRVLAEMEVRGSGQAEPPPAERKARALYQTLIASFPELPLSIDARFELAELLAGRGENDAGIKLLQETLDVEPPPELTDKVRLRLGACLAAKGDVKAARVQFEVVAKSKGRWAEVARKQLRPPAKGKALPELPPLAQPSPDRASLDDPTAGAARTTDQVSISPRRTHPAPFLRPSVPDPYEFHYRVRLPSARAENAIPAPENWPLAMK